MTYKEAIIQAQQEYCRKYDNIRYIGYNTAKGSHMYGTLKGHLNKCIEMPICENLMVGMAVGMALNGMRPVVCFERHDFLLLAMDALVNHADKLPWISGDQYKLPIVVRAIVGGSKPLDAGCQHTNDYGDVLRKCLTHSVVVEPKTLKGFKDAYALVGCEGSGMVVIIEHRDKYDEKITVAP